MLGDQGNDLMAVIPPRRNLLRKCRKYPGEKRPVASIEFGRNARRRNVDETVRSLVIEPDHPVPQRLPVHSPNLGRLGP